MLYTKTLTDSVLVPRPVSTVYVANQERREGTMPYNLWESKGPVQYAGKGVNADYASPRTRTLVGDTEWKDKISKAQFTAHPYSNTGVSFDYGSVVLENPHLLASVSVYHRVNGAVRVSGPVIGNPANVATFLPPSNSSFSNALKTEAVADAKSGALQAMVSMMEGGKTLQMFSSTVSTLANVITTARRRLAGSKKEVNYLLDRIEVHGLQDGISAYLQWRYGWRVLILEIQAAFEALYDSQHYVADVLHRDRASEELGGLATVTSTNSYEWTPYYFCKSDPFVPKIRYRQTTKSVKFRGSAAVYYRITNEAWQARNLTLSFAPTLWELIPYSFVYDWFTNVGDWLTAYASSVPGLTWQGGVYSELTALETTWSVLDGTFGSQPLSVSAQTPARLTSYRFSRSLFNPAEPLPPVVFDHLTFMRALDAVALVTQRLNGLSRDAASWRFKLPRR